MEARVAAEVLEERIPVGEHRVVEGPSVNQPLQPIERVVAIANLCEPRGREVGAVGIRPQEFVRAAGSPAPPTARVRHAEHEPGLPTMRRAAGAVAPRRRLPPAVASSNRPRRASVCTRNMRTQMSSGSRRPHSSTASSAPVKSASPQHAAHSSSMFNAVSGSIASNRRATARPAAGFPAWRL